MAVGFSKTNKPLNPRGNDQSPKGYNRAALYSGKALDFDGVNDYVDLGQNLGFINTGDFTLLANAKFDVLSGDEPIMGQGSGSTGNAALVLVNALGKLRFAFYGDDLDWDEPIQTGKWYSLAFTFNRTTKARSIYVNGQLAVSDVTTLTPNATGNTFVIGKVPYLSTYADAQITGVKAFNTALTAAQVADLYNNPEKIVPTGVDNTALKLWLPMMEGAGTTAYDGSGNGNHGTISGATYVNGVGAPVAQSAVIDWNKGSNKLVQSNTFNNTWSVRQSSVSNGYEGYNNTNDAWEIVENSLNAVHYLYQNAVTTGTNTISLYAKTNGRDLQLRVDGIGTNKAFVNYDLSAGSIGLSGGTALINSNIESLGNGWHRCSFSVNDPGTYGVSIVMITDASSSTELQSYTGNGTSGLFIQYAQIEQASSIGPYVPTFGTAQSSEVLLPQGLISGRDITGVNLFENVRKQGALNLDGNSWAEVHDNASLDITPNITLEAWIKCGDELNAVYDHIFVKPTSTTWTSPYGTYVLRLRENDVQWWFESVTNAKSYSVSLSGWNHLAVTKEGASEILYINGAQVDTKTGSATMSATIYDLLIGTRTQYATNEMIANQLAQPRIYNRALTAAEVLQNYNSGKSIYTNS